MAKVPGLSADPVYPRPPVALSANTTASLAFLALCLALFALCVVHAVRRWRRGDRVFALCLLGGLLAGALEPILDYVGLLWFASDNAVIAVRTVGRTIPLYVVLGYAFFFGAQMHIVFRGILAGRSRGFFLGCYAAAWLLDLALQGTGAQLGLYQYYGNQPLTLFGAPLWWITLDAATQLVGGLLLFGLRDLLHGWRSLVVVPLVPMVYAGLNGALGWPAFTALNSNVDVLANGNASTLLSYAGGLGTVLLSLLTVVLCLWFIERAVSGPSGEPVPARAESAAGGTGMVLS